MSDLCRIYVGSMSGLCRIRNLCRIIVGSLSDHCRVFVGSFLDLQNGHPDLAKILRGILRGIVLEKLPGSCALRSLTQDSATDSAISSD